ncbi:hypothetical protein [Thalassomonas sp. M1454]|uniref:hypothetical protein n=1 Tax=Thalassomonas sp. M1454 TaxID=2594477 RepID=UPI00117EF69A|nr:hypothetical protein [Thalassomonas sp. M1454]TRX53444.1 hypothetical protein FNN08_14315 [Thalassomonas sp. M1454]
MDAYFHIGRSGQVSFNIKNLDGKIFSFDGHLDAKRTPSKLALDYREIGGFKFSKFELKTFYILPPGKYKVKGKFCKSNWSLKNCIESNEVLIDID